MTTGMLRWAVEKVAENQACDAAVFFIHSLWITLLPGTSPMAWT
jgi:hypothetical protein